jgi:hypothetical protein
MSREQNQQEFPSKSKGLAGNPRRAWQQFPYPLKKNPAPRRLRMEGVLSKIVLTVSRGQPACTIRHWAVICPRHMARSSVHSSRWFPTLLWSNSIALSWMWGLFFDLPAEIAAAFVNYA